jgi:4a-hydroxytetrahydrobiopterin dehydratase
MSTLPLTAERITQELRNLPLWRGDEYALIRTIRFNHFPGAIAFMSAAVPEIERLCHHPEWTNVYNRVTVRLTTHDAGNRVTMLDITLAKIIDVVAMAHSAR